MVMVFGERSTPNTITHKNETIGLTHFEVVADFDDPQPATTSKFVSPSKDVLSAAENIFTFLVPLLFD